LNTPKAQPRTLKDKKASEYLLRFLFGGVVTACTGWVAHAWGPVVGGLFLGFPAILPASLTLVKQHDGRQQAVEDARGGRLGSIGLIAFGVVVWAMASGFPPWLVLLVATLAWIVVDVGLWFIRFG
jgi:hypothetical protein